jgi:hypothetical protein
VEKCFKKRRIDRTRHVNHCYFPRQTVNKNLSLVPVTIDEKKYHVLLDTGAQVSLLRDNLVHNMLTEPFPEQMVITGVGNNSFRSHSAIHVKIRFATHTFPVKMHLAPRTQSLVMP